MVVIRMIEQICAHIHNYFLTDDDGNAWHRESGEFTVENEGIALDFLVEGSYFLVNGSRFNDGVYAYPAENMSAETFTGTIWEMRPPRRFIQLAGEIEAWQAKYGDVVLSPYQSESVQGAYSYTKAASSGGGSTAAAGSWEAIFRSRLNEWRKMR